MSNEWPKLQTDSVVVQALREEQERAYVRYLKSLPRPADPFERD